MIDARVFLGSSPVSMRVTTSGRTFTSVEFSEMTSDLTKRRTKSRRSSGNGDPSVNYGLTEPQRRRLARSLGREYAEIDWVPVLTLAQALGVSLDAARTIVQAYAGRGSAVETRLPHELASDVGVNARTLTDWEARGLSGAAIGFRNSKRYVSTLCYEWVERFRAKSFEVGRYGRKRWHLSAHSVVSDVLGLPAFDTE